MVTAITPEQQEAVIDEGSGPPSDGEKTSLNSLPGVLESHYVIRPQDAKAWVAAWELTKDKFGVEYGVPCRLARGQLDHFLRKRRADGGKRFTISQPANMLALPRFECFIDGCSKRVRERYQLVLHVERIHPQEAEVYRPLLDQLRTAIVKDNPRLAELIQGIAATQDEPVRAVAVSGVLPPVMPPVAMQTATCDDCGWTKPSQNPEGSLRAHKRLHCPARKPKEATDGP